MWEGQAQLVAGTAGSGVGSKGASNNSDSLYNKLQQICEVLGRSESILFQIEAKIEGPRPDNDKLAEQPNSISAWVMEANARSQRIMNSLDTLNNRLA